MSREIFRQALRPAEAWMCLTRPHGLQCTSALRWRSLSNGKSARSVSSQQDAGAQDAHHEKGGDLSTSPRVGRHASAVNMSSSLLPKHQKQQFKASKRLKLAERPSHEEAPSHEKAPSHDETQSKLYTAPQPRSLSISVDGVPRLFSPLLLRDICQCERCVDVSTKQKLFCTSDIPIEIEAASNDIVGEEVSIRWKTDVPGFDADHTTRIDMSQLRSISKDGSTTTWPSPPRRVVWDTATFNTDIEDIDYQAYMEDDTALHTAVQQLRTHGLLFLTNVPEDADSVVKITERIGPVKNTFYGFTWDVRSVPQAKNVAYTSQDLGFHMDLMYMEQPPHIQFLHCIRSSAAGGASLFTDSFKAARDLAQADLIAFLQLCNLQVPFHYDHPESQYYYKRRSTIELPAPLNIHNSIPYKLQSILGKAAHSGITVPIEQLIDAVSWSPPFQAPFSDIRTFPDRVPQVEHLYKHPNKENRIGAVLAAYVKQAAKFNALIHRPEGIYERMMKPGECVLFDNRRVLHARRAFAVGDAGKERWLRGSYLDRDPFMSRLRILQDRFGDLPVKSQQGSASTGQVSAEQAAA